MNPVPVRSARANGGRDGLVAELSVADLARLQAVAHQHEVETGAMLYRQGAVALAGYLITDGRAAVVVGGRPVSTIGAGALVGDVDVLGRRPYRATVMAECPLTVWRIDGPDLDRLLAEAPTFARALACDLGHRLRAAEALVHAA